MLMTLWLRMVSWFNRKAKNLSIRLVKWTGKSSEYIHPKHLIQGETHYWFASFLRKSDTVLDLGTGAGAHAFAAAAHVNTVTALDYHRVNLETANRLAQTKQITNVKFRYADLEQPFTEPAGSFSAILALDVLEHLVHRDRFLTQSHRCLTPAGRLFLSVPNGETLWKQSLARRHLFYYSDLDHKHEYTEPEIKTLLETHGYKIEFFDVTVYDTPWAGVIDLIGGISLSMYKRLMDWKRKKAVSVPHDATGFRIIARKI